MMYYGHSMGPGWGLTLVFVVLVAVAGLTVLAGLLFRHTPQQPARPLAEQEAERALAARFAAGEIESEEYQRRLALLRSVYHPSGS